MVFTKHRTKIILLSLFVLMAGGSYYTARHFLFTPLEETVETVNATPIKKKHAENKTINFLILGVDERSGDVGRSDTLLILSTNLGTKRFGLISIPRDSRMEIGLHGEDKINHAYAYGGVNLSRQSIENALYMHMDHYVKINFHSFETIMDLIGGVDIDVEKDMYYEDPYDGEDGLIIDLKKGKQHLDGKKAIQYVRYRDEEGDIGRVRRQQKFLDAVLVKVATPEIFPKIPAIVKEVAGSVDTDMSFLDIIEYLSELDPDGGYTTKAVMLPGHPEMIDDISYWIPDFELMKGKLEELDSFISGNKNDIYLEDNRKENINEDRNEPPIASYEKSSIFHEVDDGWQYIDPKVTAEDIEEKKRQLQEEEKREREQEMYNRYVQKLTEAAEQQRKAIQLRAIKTGDVKIINATGNYEAANKAYELLQNAGLSSVVSDSEGGAGDKTILIISKNDTEMLNVFENMPFPITVFQKDGLYKPTLILGKDFR